MINFTKAIAMVALASLADAAYLSGEVKTIETFKYGKFVAKIKAPNKLGTCTSFFTYWNGPKWYPERWNEIDFEIVPSISADSLKGPVSTNIIFGDGN